MLIKKPDDIPSRDVTPKDVYVNRRLFMKSAVMAGSVAATVGAYRLLNTAVQEEAPREKLASLIGGATTQPATQPSGPAYDQTVARAFTTDEERTPLYHITHYN